MTLRVKTGNQEDRFQYCGEFFQDSGPSSLRRLQTTTQGQIVSNLDAITGKEFEDALKALNKPG